ncbi:MAG TPA: proton-conducting transporter membrane subunit [Bacteroidota bacterium]|nr:proton-conducting transporter membrane subunit [Bacteroidota bacterium]
MWDNSILLSLFFLLCVAGSVIALLAPDRLQIRSMAGIAIVAASVLIIWSVVGFLSGNVHDSPFWGVPFLGAMILHVDPLASWFILITAIVFFAVSLYSFDYMKRHRGDYGVRAFSVFYHLLFASIVFTLLSGDIVSFLVAWETMTIFSYLLVNYDHEVEENSRAAYIMLAMSEAGTISAAFGFLILGAAAGSFEFSAIRSAQHVLTDTARWAVFLLSFFGFGVKAGLAPVNVWLPRAHPAAPANVSALLSAVILNLGIYGIVRVNMDLLPVSHSAQGMIVLAFGTLSAVMGILYATKENDLKKMLAHSSIENMGIVIAGIGAGFVFMTEGVPSLAGIAFIAAFYHMTNHSMYKGLLFLTSGTVDAQAKTRDMNRLGGLIHGMPWTSGAFLVGALSIAALPPFNGFVSEWLTLQSFLQSFTLSSRGLKIEFVLCGALLALTAALAVTCFVKAFAMSFLGPSRSENAKNAVDPGRSSKMAHALLAIICLGLGILPTYCIPAIDSMVSPLTRYHAIDELVPPFFSAPQGNEKFSGSFMRDFQNIGAQVGQEVLPGRGLVIMHRGLQRNPVVFAMAPSYTFVMLIVLVGGTFLFVRAMTKKRQRRRAATWMGGLRTLTSNMTYSATGFSNPVRVIFSGIFHPSVAQETRHAVESHFRTALIQEHEETHILERWFFYPIANGLQQFSRKLALLHSGKVNVYAAYMLTTLIILLSLNWIN